MQPSFQTNLRRKSEPLYRVNENVIDDEKHQVFHIKHHRQLSCAFAII